MRLRERRQYESKRKQDEQELSDVADVTAGIAGQGLWVRTRPIIVDAVTQSLAKSIRPITDHGANVLYQHGTLALLVPGLLEGTTTIGELLEHGDTGIGTGEGLDGELIILDGVAYKIGQTGVAERVPDDFTMPFANSHRAAFQYQCEREDIGLKELNDRIVEANGRANTFFSVIVHGTFSFVKTRAVIKQQAPYPTLLEVADRQAIFLRHDVTGTMLGYFSPMMFHGAAVAGFHEHFLSDDHTFGGHVLDAVLGKGKIYSQVFDTLVTHLPVDDPNYRNHDFSQDNIGEAITSAEGDTHADHSA